MVLFKRKPVKFLPTPNISDQNAEIWVMQMTDEAFPDYESYIRRLDFYRQHDFTCSITGQSGLTFFEAMRSESNESRTVDDRFPDPLKDPVLRKIQFSTISRMEDLVNFIFEEFKQDFFPGEQVLVVLEDGRQYEGIIREKASYPERMDGEIRRKAFSRYFVKLHDRPMEEALVNNDQVFRSRKVFSKHMLRILLKNSLTRETWAGAPWVLKEEIAKEYKIPTEIPPRLRQGQIKADRSAQLAMRKDEREGTFFQFYANQQRLPELKPARGHRGKLSQQEMQQQKQIQLQQFQEAMLTGQFHGFAGPPPANVDYIPLLRDGNFQYGAYPQIGSRQPQMPPPPPPNRGPLEDLDIQPKHNGVIRPQLKFWIRPKDAESISEPKTHYEDNGLAMHSIGPLLETWNTLNVLCQPFVLDSFNLDDFVDAMLLRPDVSDCELLLEVHCAVLSLLVDSNGDVKASMPEMPEEDEDEEDEESEIEDSTLSTPLPDAPARSTRSSLAKQEAAALAEEKSRTSPSSKLPKHRAAEMLAGRGWIERTAAREFEDGGWQLILIGILYQLSLQPSLKEDCDAVLAHLAPIDQEPTATTAQQQYASMDVNLRISALQMITILTPSTQTVRDYLEECGEAMTSMRKEKIEQQRKKKPLIEELTSLDQQRKMLLPENLPDSDTEEAKVEPAEADVDVSETMKSEENGVEDSDDEELPTRSLRRNSGRALDRKRKREEEAARKEKEKKDREAAKNSKQSAQFKKLLRDIDKKKTEIKECEDAIADLDNDLREANCQRTRPLGRDRFWNRYWWFERNGMPYAGMPNASTAHCGYANGRVWVQGPSADERAGFLDLPRDEAAAYHARHGVSLSEREAHELGPSHLRDANDWGYYDDPADLDALIGWLDERGKREKELRKELQHWRDQIAVQMDALREHLTERERRRWEAEEEAETGVVTRHGRRDVEKDLDLKRHPCLEWRNGMARREMGRRHAEPSDNSGGTRKKGKKKGVAEVVAKKKKAPVEQEPELVKARKMETRSTRSGRR
ncbi:MAG: hypothetical protein M1822_007549 [Bathelium mastoideum]|nr:MAG: hypothetical protein M1822_007549 [Bathelium mastoideum]